MEAFFTEVRDLYLHSMLAFMLAFYQCNMDSVVIIDMIITEL